MQNSLVDSSSESIGCEIEFISTRDASFLFPECLIRFNSFNSRLEKRKLAQSCWKSALKLKVMLKLRWEMEASDCGILKEHFGMCCELLFFLWKGSSGDGECLKFRKLFYVQLETIKIHLWWCYYNNPFKFRLVDKTGSSNVSGGRRAQDGWSWFGEIVLAADGNCCFMRFAESK